MDQEVVAYFKKKYYAGTYKQLHEATDTSFGNALHSVAENYDKMELAEELNEETKTIWQWWKEYTIRNAIDDAVIAWREISSEQIVRTWRLLLGVTVDAGNTAIGKTDTESEEVLTQLQHVMSAFASMMDEFMQEVLNSGKKEFAVEKMVQEMEREAVSEGEEEVIPRCINHKDVVRVLEQVEILKNFITEIISDITERSMEVNEVDMLSLIHQYREMYKKHINHKHQPNITSYFKPKPAVVDQTHQIEEPVVDILKLSGDGSTVVCHTAPLTQPYPFSTAQI